jgi:hypothetical protein
MQEYNQKRWYNEKGELVASFPQERQISNWVICSKCLRAFDSLSEAKLHLETCCTNFSDIIFRKDELKIARVAGGSSNSERSICELSSCIEQLEDSWQRRVLRNDNWVTSQYNSKAFLLLEKSSIAACLVIRDRVPNEEKCTAVANMFTIQHYRGKGYMTKLMSQALSSLGVGFGSAVYLGDFSPAGKAYLKSIVKSQGLKTIKTFSPELAADFSW